MRMVWTYFLFFSRMKLKGFCAAGLEGWQPGTQCVMIPDLSVFTEGVAVQNCLCFTIVRVVLLLARDCNHQNSISVSLRRAQSE